MPKIHASRIGFGPAWAEYATALQEELVDNRKIVVALQEEIQKRDLEYRRFLEDTNARHMEERKKCMLQRKAADDEILRLRSKLQAVEDLVEKSEEPPMKKQKLGLSNAETKLCGAEEFDAAFFDEASAAWNANKIRDGLQWKYKCINPRCDQEGEFDFDLCCYECYDPARNQRLRARTQSQAKPGEDKVCRNGSYKIRVTSKKKRGFCNECFETCA